MEKQKTNGHYGANGAPAQESRIPSSGLGAGSVGQQLAVVREQFAVQREADRMMHERQLMMIREEMEIQRAQAKASFVLQAMDKCSLQARELDFLENLMEPGVTELAINIETQFIEEYR